MTVFRLSELRFKNWNQIYTGQKNISVRWGKTYISYDTKTKEFYAETLTWIGRLFHLFGYKRYLCRRSLWNGLREKKLVDLTKIPSKQEFRAVVAKILARPPPHQKQPEKVAEPNLLPKKEDEPKPLINSCTGLDDLLNTSALSARRMVEFLTGNPELKAYYEKKIESENQKTVEYQAQSVLASAEQYRATFEPMVARLCSWNEFLLFLSLHDIGRGIVQERMGGGVSTPISFRKENITITSDILQRILSGSGIPAGKIKLFQAMLAYDVIPPYLTNAINDDEAFDNVLEMADRADADPAAFYPLFVAYHMAVSASSAREARLRFLSEEKTIRYKKGHESKIRALEETISFISQGELLFAELVQSTKDQVPLETFQKKFLHALPKLIPFLESKHKKMLRLNPGEFQQQRESFRKIKRDFKDIHSYVLKRQNPPIAITKSYTDLQKTIPTCLRGKQVVDHHHTSMLEQWIYRVYSFRKDYIIRNLVNKKEPEIFGRAMTMEERDLLQMTALLFTNACKKSLITLTGGKIIPHEQFTKMRLPIWSHFPAELTTYDPCFSLEEIVNPLNTILHYTKMMHLEAALGKLKEFAENNGPIQAFATPSENGNTIEDSGWLSNYETYVLSVQRILPEIKLARAAGDKFRPLQDLLRETFISRIQAFDKLKETPYYKSRMHKREWYQIFSPMESIHQDCLKAVTEPVIFPPDIAESLDDPYPMVFASKTMTTHTVQTFQDQEQVFLDKTPSLGLDIQALFVPSDKIQDAALWLTSLGFQDQVALHSLDHLKEITILHDAAQGYFYALASRKKE